MDKASDKDNSSFLGTEMVDIYVGKERKHYRIHKDPICKHSRFFSTMFQDIFKEGKTKECHLVDEEPAVFDFIIKCVYAGHFPADCAIILDFILPRQPVHNIDTDTQEEPSSDVSLFLKVYHSLDRYLFDRLHHKAYDTFHRLLRTERKASWPNHTLSDQDIRFALMNFAAGDYLLENIIGTVVENYCTHIKRSDEWLTTILEDVPIDNIVRFCHMLKWETEQCKLNVVDPMDVKPFKRPRYS